MQRQRTIGRLAAAGILVATTVVLLPAAPAGAVVSPPVGRLSVGTGTGASGLAIDSTVLIDGSGRYVGFTSDQALVPEDTNGAKDAYLRDRLTDRTVRVGLAVGGAQPSNGSTKICGMSDDARYVAFASSASNFAGSTPQIFRRDRVTGNTQMVSVSSAELPGNGVGSSLTARCGVSDNGRYIAFVSASNNLVALDSSTGFDIFVRDVTAGTTERVSVSSAEAQADASSSEPSISADGNLVAFSSGAANLAAGDADASSDVFVRNRSAGTTELVSVSSAEVHGNASSISPQLSADGTKVAFSSGATNLVASDTNGFTDVFVRNRTAGTTSRVSLNSSDAQIAGPSSLPSMTDDGTVVAFRTSADAGFGDGNGEYDIYLRDLDAGTTVLVSGSVIGLAADAESVEAAVSDDGRVIAFRSYASTLVRDDTNGKPDAFAREIPFGLAPFASVDALVAQQFTDFAGRAPTTAERDLWRARLVNGEYSVDHHINALAHSTTWSGRRSPIIRLYWAFFLRKPDAGGLTYWTNKLATGTSLPAVASSYAASSEFQNTYGALSNSAFVTLVYENVLERSPDAGGLAYWKGKLDNGTFSRGDVMVGFSESSEGVRFLAPQVDVVLIHLGMLRQMPAEGLFATWTAQLEAGIAPEVFVRGLRVSAPYASRF